MKVILALGLLSSLACTPTVQIAAPKEPIVINLNVKIEHEVVVKIDRELDDAYSANPGIFE